MTETTPVPMTTTSFRRLGTELPMTQTGHRPGCRVTDYMVSGLYAKARCVCRLDPAVPMQYYMYQLTVAEADAWFTHFDYFTSQEPLDDGDEESMAWADTDAAFTDELAGDLAGATGSGIFSLIEIWGHKDGSRTLVMGYVTVKPEEGEEYEVAIPIAVAYTGSFSIYDLLYTSVPKEVPAVEAYSGGGATAKARAALIAEAASADALRTTCPVAQDPSYNWWRRPRDWRDVRRILVIACALVLALVFVATFHL